MDDDEKRQILLEAYVGFFNNMNACYRQYDIEMRQIRKRFLNRIQSKIKANIRSHQMNLMNTIEMMYMSEFPPDDPPERQIKKRCLRKERSSDWWDAVKNSHDDAIWSKYFSVNRETFIYLCQLFADEFQPKSNEVIQYPTFETKIGAALYLLTTNQSYFDVGQKFGIHALSVQRSLMVFCEACTRLLQTEFIHMPKNEELLEIRQQFEEKFGVPQVVGVLEGSLISISSEAVGFTSHVMESGSSDLILQVVIDSNCLIRNVALLEKSEDFQEYYSNIAQLMSRMEPREVECIPIPIPALLTSRRADSVQSCILKPFTNSKSPEDMIFNGILDKHSELGQMAFKKLKGRWKILQEPMKVSVSSIPNVIVTCCILHNILETKGIASEQELDEVDLYDQQVDENVAPEEDDLVRQFLRDYICLQFV